MYGAAQRLLHNHPSLDLPSDLDLASKCLRVLERCSQCDTVAGKFYETSLLYHDLFSSLTPGTIHGLTSAAPFYPPPQHYSFTPVLGSTPVHQAARDLSKLLCRPFRGNPKIVERDTPTDLWPSTQISLDETALGVHRDWKWEDEPVGADAGIDQGILALEVMSGLQEGYFLDSIEPSGWVGGMSAYDAGSRGLVSL